MNSIEIPPAKSSAIQTTITPNKIAPKIANVIILHSSFHLIIHYEIFARRSSSSMIRLMPSIFPAKRCDSTRMFNPSTEFLSGNAFIFLFNSFDRAKIFLQFLICEIVHNCCFVVFQKIFYCHFDSFLKTKIKKKEPMFPLTHPR